MPQQVHLYASREEALLMSSPAGSLAPLTQLECLQDVVLEIYCHDLRRANIQPLDYSERPFRYSALRVAVGPVDGAPEAGTFKLRVGSATTAALTWPGDLSTTELKTAWKATVLDALKGLAGVGPSGIVAEDGAATPAHLFTFRWTDDERTDVVEVVDNYLAPFTEFTVTAAFPRFELKLSVFPYKATSAFSHPAPPVVLVGTTRPGASGTNAEQTIAIPLDATGSFALQWSGASTKTLRVDTVKASEVAAALNAIVADGSSNPSFRAEERGTKNDTRRIAVEFIGPLAAAAQPEFGVTMHDQLARPWVVGQLDLRGNLGIERALAGQAELATTFELTIDEDEKYQLPLRIVNSLTGPETAEHLAESGGVVTLERTVLVDDGLGVPVVSAAPGLEFTPPEAGSSFGFAHSFASRRVSALVFQKVASGPETWVEVRDGSWELRTTSDSIATVRFASPLVADEDDPLYFGNFRVRIIAPDSTLSLYPHEHSWDECRDSLPGGMTVRAKFAALDAAVGVVGGTIKIPAENITGLISARQIDVTAVAKTLVEESEFEKTIISELQKGTVIDKLAETLKTSATFTETLKTQIQSTDIATTIGDALTKEAAFQEQLRSEVISYLRTGNVPAGGTLLTLPDFFAAVPPFETYDGPPRTRTDYRTTTTATDGTTVTGISAQTMTEPTEFRVFFALSPAVTSPTLTGTPLTGALPDSGTDGMIYPVSGAACSRATEAGRPRGETFGASQLITFRNNHWYAVVKIGDYYYAAENELLLAKWSVTASQMSGTAGSSFLWPLPLSAALESESGIEGTIRLVVELSERKSAGSGDALTTPADLSSAVYYELFSEELALGPATLATTVLVEVSRAADGTLSGSYTAFGRKTTFAPSSALPNFTAAVGGLLTFASAHGLVRGSRVRFASTGTLPAGLSAGTDYFVLSAGLTSTQCYVSETVTGSLVAVSSTGSGTHSARKMSALNAAGFDLRARLTCADFPDGVNACGSLVISSRGRVASLVSL